MHMLFVVSTQFLLNGSSAQHIKEFLENMLSFGSHIILLAAASTLSGWLKNFRTRLPLFYIPKNVLRGLGFT
uniref:Uncharacterized protein n=1 Tax=Arundo donax TaxID=35708 RepID=A0A0A9H4G2_ARUDO